MGMVPESFTPAVPRCMGTGTGLQSRKMVWWILVEAVLSHRIHAKKETALTEFYKRIARKRGSSKAIHRRV